MQIIVPFHTFSVQESVTGLAKTIDHGVFLQEDNAVQTRGLLPLSIALLMFPQMAQTLFSPALADFARAFSVPPEAASQALTVYFAAFAVGVFVWGRACDRIGRKPAMLCGLFVYALACCAAFAVTTFDGLLLSQAVAAFGAAVGSVVTQTVLRDRYAGAELARIFSVVGMVLAASPAIGLFAGAALVQAFGYKGVVAALFVLSSVLIAWTVAALPRTHLPRHAAEPLSDTLKLMLRDTLVWRSALLVAVLNVALYSYYDLGPFVFQRLHLDPDMYGYSGALLALGASLGAWLNRQQLKAGSGGEHMLRIASVLMLASALGVAALQNSPWFLVPMLLVVVAFGVAIPNVLGHALAAYKDKLGTAGALFGLLYYLMIGAGMMATAWTQALGGTLIVCGVIAVMVCVVSGWRRGWATAV
jgi:predicted MFS family arabinose efflux permease